MADEVKAEKKPQVAAQIELPEFEVMESPHFKAYSATGVFGGLNPNGGRIIFYLDRIKPTADPSNPGGMKLQKVEHELQVEVHVSPAQFKSIAEWMMGHVSQFEKQFGNLKKIEDKAPENMYS